MNLNPCHTLNPIRRSSNPSLTPKSLSLSLSLSRARARVNLVHSIARLSRRTSKLLFLYFSAVGQHSLLFSSGVHPTSTKTLHHAAPSFHPAPRVSSISLSLVSRICPSFSRQTNFPLHRLVVQRSPPIRLAIWKWGKTATIVRNRDGRGYFPLAPSATSQWRHSRSSVPCEVARPDASLSPRERGSVGERWD